MKKIITLKVLLLSLLFVGCPDLLPNDPFARLEKDVVLKSFEALMKTGGYQGLEYAVSLDFDEETKAKIQAIEWRIFNSLGDEVEGFSHIDLAEEVKDKESERKWNPNYNFSAVIRGLSIENYDLYVTIYDFYAKQEDGKPVFRDAKFKRIFRIPFVITQPPVLEGLSVYAIQDGQDTGFSKTDRVTFWNKNMRFFGMTKLPKELTDNPTAEFYFTITDLPDRKNPKRSENLTNVGIGLGVNELRWEWTYNGTLPDGRWSIDMNIKYQDETGSEVIRQSDGSFIVTIDTVAPELCWEYKLEGGALKKNIDKNSDLPLDQYIETPFGFYIDLEDQALKDQYKRYNEWSFFVFKDGSSPKESGLTGTGSEIFRSTNFIPLQTGEFRGFSPTIAGVQELEVVAWDAAGNQSTNSIKRKMKVANPELKKNFENPSFEAVEGTSDWNSNYYDPYAEKAAYKGWTGDIYWIEEDGAISEVKNWADPFQNPMRFFNNNSSKYLICFVKNEGGNKVLNWKETAWDKGSFWLKSCGGKVYQTFKLYQGVTYKVTGKSRSGAVSPDDIPESPIALFVEPATPSSPIRFSGTGKQGNFPFSVAAGIEEGKRIYRSDFPKVNGGEFQNAELQFIPSKSGLCNVGFAKQGRERNCWSQCDEITFEIINWEKVTP